MISTSVLIGAIVGAVIGAVVGGIVTYNVAQDSGAEGWELFGWTASGVVGGSVIGAIVGAAIGYGIGYLAGGTYANGLGAKSVNQAVKSFLSNRNNIHHVLDKPAHKLIGYSEKAMAKLMKNTLAKGVYEAYKTVDSMVLASTNSQVTYIIIDGVIYISDMWIK